MNWTTHHTFGEASRHVWYESLREITWENRPCVIFWDLVNDPTLFILAAAQGGP